MLSIFRLRHRPSALGTKTMKNSALVLRIAIAIEWILIAVAFTIALTRIDAFPPELKAYSIHQAPSIAIVDTISVLALLVSIITSFGLCLRRSWAQLPYAASTIWLSCASFFEGPTANLGLLKGLEELSLLAGGFVIAWSFFPGVLHSSTGGQEHSLIN